MSFGRVERYRTGIWPFRTTKYRVVGVGPFEQDNFSTAEHAEIYLDAYNSLFGFDND